MASGEEPAESLKCKTWVLKVSIHCEGCKKKVKRILRSIPGVYDCEIDAKQHKVSVKASVDSETLIRKLGKSGKHAALWPEKKPSNPNPQNVDASSEKENKESSTPKEASENSENNGSPPESNPAAAAGTAAPAQASDADKPDDVKAKSPTEPQKPDTKTEDGNASVPQSSDAKNADASLSQQPEKPAAAAAAKADSNEKAPAGGEAASGNGGGKKKGSKVPKESSVENDIKSDSGTTKTPSPPAPPQYMYSYDPAYAPPPPPAYVMSYNVAQPSISHSHYASPMPPAAQGYSYMPYPPPPEFYYGSMDPSLSSTQPSPHDMFSDENPNACNLM
ncbi:hypothetical protein Cni_G19098 [Canna indica]|uniref:HMA domain-containing protein n=1 Tax=Canna indica TaxID=4628 RepID=A0AAQ3KNV6_9LILI|nr:hypothetical protein Cni_G19098 [Canna indica]